MDGDSASATDESTPSQRRCPYPGEDTVSCPACGTDLEYVIRVEDTTDRARCPHCEREITRVE